MIPKPIEPRVTDGGVVPTGGARRLRAVWIVAAGAICALALPPLHLLPVLFVGFGFLVWRLEHVTSLGGALLCGWLFGFGYFSAGLYWLGLPVVIDVDGDTTKDLLLIAGLAGVPAAILSAGTALRLMGGRRPWLIWLLAGLVVLLAWVALAVAMLPGRFTWMIPFNVFGLGALLATTTGVAVALAWKLGGGGLRRILVLAIAWAALEWVRGTILSGFPWNLIANVWTAFPAAAQSAAWWGSFGLGLVTVLLASLPALFLRRRSAGRGDYAWYGAVGGACIVVLLAGFAILPGPSSTVPKIKLRIVQGAVAQKLKWARGAREQIMARYGKLTAAKGFRSITHVIWPETAIPYRLQTQYDVVLPDAAAIALIQASIPKDGALITGANRDVGKDTWNSVHVLTGQGRIVSTYDKHHLVPFGEYVPARSFLSRIGIAKIAHGRGDYSFGRGPHNISIPGAPAASPLICYEAIFPAEAVGKNRPGWLLNVTNDAWFGNSAGPYQHFSSARLRAIEQGLPLVRAANTGISAVVDPYGRVTGYLPLGARGVLDAALPKARSPTPYARFGDLSFLVFGLLVGFLAAFAPARPEPTVT